MATRVLRVEIVGDARKFGRAVDDAERKTGKFSGVVSKLGGVAGGLLAGGAVLEGLRRVRAAGTDLNETVNKVGLAFGKNQGAIQAWAATSAKSMGLPKQAALEGASSFGLLFSKIGVGAGDTAKMSKAMVQLAVDLGSVHNADPTEVIEAQTAAFRGEYDSLQRFVPAINAAAVETEALAQTHKKNAKELTDAEKAQAVYSIMLKQTTKEQGDFARTSGEAANQSKINAARMQDLAANAGTILLPAITALSGGLGALADWIEENRTAATALGVAIVAVTGFVVAMNAATKVSAAVQAAAKAATIAWTAGQWLLNAALTANPIGVVVVAVAALTAGLILAYKHSETFRKVVDAAFRSVAAAARFMWESVLKPVFRFVVSTWLTVASGIVHGAAIAFGWVPGIGGKLRGAAAAFDRFAGQVNRSLNSIDDEKVKVTASAGITWTAEASRFRQRAGRMATGGLVTGPGTSTSDSVPALLSRGEFVMSAAAVRAMGVDQLRALNAMRFAGGGLVPRVGISNQISTAPFQQMTTGLAKGLGAAVGQGLMRAMAEAFMGGGAGPRVSGPVADIVRTVASRYGWGAGAQWSALSWIISHESGWRPTAQNPTSTAYGLFQFLDGTWAGVGGHKTSDPFLQAVYGLRYIAGRYGSPLGAQAFWRSHGWYDRGGWLPPGLSVAYNGTGRPERVMAPGQGGDVHVHLHGPVLGGDARRVARELEPAIRNALKASLGREGKALAKQL